MKGFTIMYDYRGKVSGYIISALGIAAMVAERLHPFILNRKWSAEQHYGVFEWVALLGLFLIMYSKEKVDDERTKQIRLKAIQIAFMLMAGTTMAFGFTGVVSGSSDLSLGGREMYLIPAMGVMLYLLIFHVGLYFDEVWEYEDKGLVTNLRSISANKWGILAYLGVCAILMLLLALM